MSATLSLRLFNGETKCRVQRNDDYDPQAYDGVFIEELSNHVYLVPHTLASVPIHTMLVC